MKSKDVTDLTRDKEEPMKGIHYPNQGQKITTCDGHRKIHKMEVLSTLRDDPNIAQLLSKRNTLF